MSFSLPRHLHLCYRVGWRFSDRRTFGVPVTDERLKIVFGFIMLLGVLVIIVLFGLGKVHEESSYGLRELITILGVLGGGFAVWAFNSAPKQ